MKKGGERSKLGDSALVVGGIDARPWVKQVSLNLMRHSIGSQ